MNFLKQAILFFTASATSVVGAADLPSLFGVGGQLDDVSPVSAVEDKFEFWRITPKRAGHVNLRNQAGVEIGTDTAPISQKIIGATTSTAIGNTGDRLKVDATLSSSLPPTVTSKIRYMNMNKTTGGVDRATVVSNTAWTTVFSYSGNGLVHGWNLNLETPSEWLIRFVVDGGNIFEGYDHSYTYQQVITATPNSFPNATYQVVTITPTQKNNTLYTVTLNGTNYTYTSDGNATVAEIVTGLKTPINADGPLPITATGTNTIILTSDILGTAYTYSVGANLAAVLTTANVPLEVYRQTINSTNYNYTSDGTPTASEVVEGLKTVILADSGRIVTPTGTAVLTLTGITSGNYYTYSSSSNVTDALLTPDPFTSEPCSGGCLYTNDMSGDQLYDLDAYNVDNQMEDYSNLGVHFGKHEKVMWGFTSLPLKFDSSVSIQIRRSSTGVDKKFNAGLIVITKGI